jgi:hypothetical protein
MQLEYTEIKLSGIPIHPIDFSEKISTSQRIIADGLHIELTNLTDKYFQSVDSPYISKHHKIQSKISDKYILNLYAKENINIDMLKVAPEIEITMKDETKLNAIIIDVTKEKISNTFTYKYVITFYNINLDIFSINNYLTSDYLLNQSYADDLVKCVATGNRGFYSAYFKLGVSSIPTTNDFEPFYYYFGSYLELIIPSNETTESLKSPALWVDSTCINSANVSFTHFVVSTFDDNYIRITILGAGFVADEVSLGWNATGAINLTFYTKLLPEHDAVDVKEKKSELTGIDIVYSSTNNKVCNTRFYMTRDDANLARTYIPRCDPSNGGSVYIEYNGIKYYSYERVIPDIPKKDELIDIKEVNININYNLNNFYNFV